MANIIEHLRLMKEAQQRAAAEVQIIPLISNPKSLSLISVLQAPPMPASSYPLPSPSAYEPYIPPPSASAPYEFSCDHYFASCILQRACFLWRAERGNGVA